MAERSCCQGNWRSRFFAKLGGCPRCMRVSLALTIGMWLMVAVMSTLGLAPVAGMLVWVAALAATALTVAHFTMFLTRVRVATELRKEDGTVEPVVVQYSVGRRAFLAHLPVGLAGLAAVVLGRALPVEAARTTSWCVYTVSGYNYGIDPRFCKIAIGDTVCVPCGGNCSDVTLVCAKNACGFNASLGVNCGTCPGGSLKPGNAWNCN